MNTQLVQTKINMSKTTKTILIVVSIIIIISLIIFGIFFFRKDLADVGIISDERSEKLSFFGFISDNDFGLLPGGKDVEDEDVENMDIIDVEKAKLPNLRMISSGPVAGATWLKKTIITDIITETEEERVFTRFMKRETGHVYDTDIITMEERRVSNTTIPKVHEVLWGGSGTQAIVRYFDEESREIKSFSGSIEYDEVIQEGSLNGVFLPDNISNLSVSQDKERIFYLIDEQSSVLGTTSNLDGSKKIQIFDFQFTEWLPQWIGNYIFMTTKPSFGVKGYLYSLSKNSGTMERILGNVFGLTTLVDNSGENILYSESTQGGFSLYLFNIEGGSTERVPFETLPEKCVWSEDGIKIYCAVPSFIPRMDYPDTWYKGVVSFTDNIWVFDTKTKTLDVLAEIETSTNTKMDITKLFLDEDGEYLFFTNKKDRSLWVLELTTE